MLAKIKNFFKPKQDKIVISEKAVSTGCAPVVIQSSRGLLSFYKAWLAFAEGCNSKVFIPDVGLCSNARRYAIIMDAHDLVREMESQFKIAGLCHYYPFNVDAECYVAECENKRVTKNLLRLQWVRDRIADGECK